jgi:hypothetical protein
MSEQQTIYNALAALDQTGKYVPVIVKTENGVRVLGTAGDHKQADVIGQAARIAFGRISMASVTNPANPKAPAYQCFVLRP